nr:hypothetical protein [Tanacetum cinerariifolium]
MHIPYTNVKMFTYDVLSKHVGEKKLNSIDGVGTGRMTKKEKNEKASDGGRCLEEKNRLISQAYASFYVAFIIWSSILITLPEEFRFS